MYAIAAADHAQQSVVAVGTTSGSNAGEEDHVVLFEEDVAKLKKSPSCRSPLSWRNRNQRLYGYNASIGGGVAVGSGAHQQLGSPAVKYNSTNAAGPGGSSRHAGGDGPDAGETAPKEQRMAADRRRKLSVSAAENKLEIDRAFLCNDRVELLISTGACCPPTVAGREAARATDELYEEPDPDEAGKSYGVQRCIQHCVQRCFQHCVGSSYY
eukprot:g6611.t1